MISPVSRMMVVAVLVLLLTGGFRVAADGNSLLVGLENDSTCADLIRGLDSRFAPKTLGDTILIKVSGPNSLRAKLEKEKFVTDVEEDGPCQVAQFSGQCSSESDAPWGLQRISKRNLDLDGTYDFNSQYLGEGVDVYFLDSGILMTHDEFQSQGSSRVRWGADFVNTPSQQTDDYGHGTSVSSIAVGNTVGVARKATAVAVKVTDNIGSGQISTLIAGIDWVIADHQAKSFPRKSIINLSLIAGKSNLLKRAVESAMNAGIVVVAVAGNGEQDACRTMPGGIRDVITVACSNQADEACSYSNYGRCVSIYAPGDNITVAFRLSDCNYTTISGGNTGKIYRISAR
ncbi:extracellular serine proteinase-like isoform X2 [Tubulanus polymorphus]|uniref:extracellular serine proteinase-like isoform X2 n=1 Tax=Tubulanus polymorphus TaxID=672921 RepID=UPI003DA31B97